MASGKSTVGRRLSELTGAHFTDMDTEIEHRERMPIHRIFSQKGEVPFRRLETALLHKIGETCSEKRRIVATGGGLPCTDDNMDYMNNRGVTVYIKASIDDIVSRVEQSRNRPVFHRIGSRKGLEELLGARETFYSRAHIQIENGNSVSPEHQAELLARILVL